MKYLFITDSLRIKRRESDYLFCQNICDWRVDKERGCEGALKRRFKIEEGNGLFAVVSPENYRLVAEVDNFGGRRRLFDSSGFLAGEARELTESEISRSRGEFEKYLKRMYLSYLSYDVLFAVGVRHIEEYLFLMTVKGLSKRFDTRIFDRAFVGDNKVDILALVDFISAKDGVHPGVVASKILQAEYKGDVSGAFSGTAILSSREWRSMASEAALFCREKGGAKKIPGIFLINRVVSDIYPVRDFLMLLIKMYKTGKVLYNEESGGLFLPDQINDKIKLYANASWLSKERWREIYGSSDYCFVEKTGLIEGGTGGFSCPVCGSGKYRTSPFHIFCKAKGCRFSFLRTNLSAFGVPLVSVLDGIMAIQSGGVEIKVSGGGVLKTRLRNLNSSYWLEVVF